MEVGESQSATNAPLLHQLHAVLPGSDPPEHPSQGALHGEKGVRTGRGEKLGSYENWPLLGFSRFFS